MIDILLGYDYVNIWWNRKNSKFTVGIQHEGSYSYIQDESLNTAIRYSKDMIELALEKSRKESRIAKAKMMVEFCQLRLKESNLPEYAQELESLKEELELLTK